MEHKSLTQLIESNKIASTSAKAFLNLGGAALCAASNIKIGFDILQNQNAPEILIGLMGFQGVVAIICGYKSAMNFADLGQMLEEENNKPATVKVRMR